MHGWMDGWMVMDGWSWMSDMHGSLVMKAGGEDGWVNVVGWGWDSHVDDVVLDQTGAPAVGCCVYSVGSTMGWCASNDASAQHWVAICNVQHTALMQH